MINKLLILLAYFSSTAIFSSHVEEGRKGLKFSQLHAFEQTILTRILSPLQTIKRNLLLNQVNAQTKQNLETVFNEIHFSDEELRNLNTSLTEDEQVFLAAIIDEFLEFIKTIDELDKRYIAEEEIVVRGTRATAALFAVGCVLVMVLLFEEFAEFACVKTVCDNPDHDIIFYKFAGERHHFCAQKGVDYQCLKYQEDVVGKYDLVGHHTYLIGCSKELDPTLIDTEIPLGRFHREENFTCQLAVGFLPLIGFAPALVEGALFGGLLVYSAVKINHLEGKFTRSLQWDRVQFFHHTNKLTSDTLFKLRKWLLLMGKACEMPGCGECVDILENWMPYRRCVKKRGGIITRLSPLFKALRT